MQILLNFFSQLQYCRILHFRLLDLTIPVTFRLNSKIDQYLWKILKISEKTGHSGLLSFERTEADYFRSKLDLVFEQSIPSGIQNGILHFFSATLGTMTAVTGVDL